MDIFGTPRPEFKEKYSAYIKELAEEGKVELNDKLEVRRVEK